MSSIWKYAFAQGKPLLEIEVPIGSIPLHFDMQYGRIPTIWMIVDQEGDVETRRFRLYGTGHAMLAGIAVKHIGSAQSHDGYLVLHCFEENT